MSNNLSLLSSTTRVECPFIKVTIGDYTFGVYSKSTSVGYDAQGAYKLNKIRYPNYVQSLSITKVNGAVNKYTLTLEYPITENDDPNFFEKVFSSVSQTRKIIFSYGDITLPAFCYRDEEALITDVKSSFSVTSPSITYTVSAVSTGKLASVGSFTFPACNNTKPSDVIFKILYNPDYGLQDLFTGMTNRGLVEQKGLIARDDKAVDLVQKTNMSVLDYLSYLVDMMSPYNDTGLLRSDGTLYLLSILDDTSGTFNGPYFKVTRTDKIKETSTAYDLDIGFPSQNIVTEFKLDDDNTYSLYYNYADKLNDTQYVQRINDRGEIEEVYAPLLSSGTATRKTTEAEKTWWTKITQYTIKAKVTLKGLLRPAILMTNVRLNVYYFGRRHIASGLYIVTKEQDSISKDGFTTTLNMTRIGKANDL
jgi:hypothetical protein